MYDTQKIASRLQTLRNERWKQYKDYEKSQEEGNLEKQKEYARFKKYVFCKSQETFAEELNMERRSVGRWENGDTPSIDNIIEICKVLDCSIDYLLGSGDVPDADPISKANLYSGISPEIIRYGKENADYLDCLNFFMLPENCKSIFNDINLSAWKKYWVDSKLTDIKSPLKEMLIESFDEYTAITPFSDICKNSYLQYTKSKLSKDKFVFAGGKTNGGVNIKDCIDKKLYIKFLEDKTFDFEKFIDYLADNSYEPLTYNAMLEVKKDKLSKEFIKLFTKYLENLD